MCPSRHSSTQEGISLPHPTLGKPYLNPKATPRMARSWGEGLQCPEACPKPKLRSLGGSLGSVLFPNSPADLGRCLQQSFPEPESSLHLQHVYPVLKKTPKPASTWASWASGSVHTSLHAINSHRGQDDPGEEATLSSLFCRKGNRGTTG